MTSHHVKYSVTKSRPATYIDQKRSLQILVAERVHGLTKRERCSVEKKAYKSAALIAELRDLPDSYGQLSGQLFTQIRFFDAIKPFRQPEFPDFGFWRKRPLSGIWAILPVHPIHWMCCKVSIHRFAQGRIESMFAKTLKESEALELIFDRVLHLRKAQFDAGGL